jgi:hypothetical protein
MELLKELSLLAESLDENVKSAKPHLNKISMMLFGEKCGPVSDPKRSKEAKYFGVANTRSKIHDSKGRGIKLTFDNSTDSGEFEINSLTPLKIVKDSDLDKKIRSLYKRHKVHSKKKTDYVDVDGDVLLRELHLGEAPSESAVKLVRDTLKLIRGEKLEEPEQT